MMHVSSLYAGRYPHVLAETNAAILCRAAWLTLIELSEKTYHCSESFQRDQSCGVTITQSAMKLVVALFICSAALIAGFAAATPGKLPDNFYHYCFAKQISDDILPPPPADHFTFGLSAEVGVPSIGEDGLGQQPAVALYHTIVADSDQAGWQLVGS